MPSSDTRLLAEALIARRSVTPEDAGCIDLIRERLAPLGFQSEVIDSGPADGVVRNLWSKRPAAGSSRLRTEACALPPSAQIAATMMSTE